MGPISRGENRSAGKAVPFDIYASLVDSLFDDGRSLLIGSFAVSACALVSVWKTGNFILLGFAVAFGLVAMMRIADMRRYWKGRQKLTTVGSVRRWEISYVIGATVSDALLGLWCFVAFATSDDSFVQLLSFSITLAYLIG